MRSAKQRLAEKIKKLNKILEAGQYNHTTEDMIVYKKARRKGTTYDPSEGVLYNTCIVTLLIPKGSLISHHAMWDRKFRFKTFSFKKLWYKRRKEREEKCRANQAKVLEIRAWDPIKKKLGKNLKHAHSMYVKPDTWGERHKRTSYRLGRMVYPDWFDSDPQHTCSNGIHFFTTIEEAMNY